ncbi:CvfB family protein [Aerococcus christensenii]|uniref:CvfB family protein n=1 Tax=Aerococcus christensenii TaxID=87541 RepID=UPI00076330F3|nr:S1-like domain-containing RNA-binding protein [Aerococcus christensenii]AMB92068.1 DNA-binding protein [Aerococcus christensenii]
MNKDLGSIVNGKIIDENTGNYFFQYQGITYQLPKSLVQKGKLGGQCEAFIYLDQKNHPKATQIYPSARQNRYGWAEVTEVRPELGCFVSIGLPDKDMVVSLDDLPGEKNLWPKSGDRLLVKLIVDKKDRQWAVPADQEVFQDLTTKIRGNKKRWMNQIKEVTVYATKLMGTYAITEDYYQAFIHPSEREVEPRLGQKVKGRVIGIGQNGNLNLSLKPRSFEAISEDAQMLLALMDRQVDGCLPFNDKSDPKAIRQALGISKAQFKRALGHLLKQKQVIQTEKGIQRVN